MTPSAEYYGDHNCPEIQSLVQELSRATGSDDIETFVRHAFAWVRDQVAYEWQLNWSVPVQETLARRKGNCVAKSCLLVTLLRARGVEAAYAVASIPLPSAVVEGMGPAWAWRLLPQRVNCPHAAAMVKLGESDEDWTILDATVDQALAWGQRAMGNAAAVTDPWRGGRHVAVDDFLQRNPQRHDDIVFVQSKKPAYRPAVAALFNASAEYLRHHRQSLASSSPKVVQQSLDEHLLRHASRSIIAMAMPLPRGSDAKDALLAAIGSGDSSVFCNDQHPAIQAISQQMRRRASRVAHATGLPEPRAYAQAAFRFVRDRIDYHLQSDWTLPAEQTLAMRRGMCSTKSCLLTALLRAGGLKAGFFLVRHNAAESFIAPSWISEHYGTKSIHVMSAVQFPDDPVDKWTRLDVHLDTNLAKSTEMAAKRPNAFFSDFDGYNDAYVGSESVESMDLQTENINRLMTKQSRMEPAVLQCHNISIELVRIFGSLFSSYDDAVKAQEMHLMNFYPHLVAKVLRAGAAKKTHQNIRQTSVLSSRYNTASSLFLPPGPVQALGAFRSKL